MSKCAQGTSPANSDRISPAVRAPAHLPPMFFMSAIGDSTCLR